MTGLDLDGDGRADEPDLVLLCWNCHHHVHHHGWTVIGDHISGLAIHRNPTGARVTGQGRRR